VSRQGEAHADRHDASDALCHRSILASAGSGKTYQLASRYLRLLWLGAEPSSILATTFTRAAAGEIRDRILSWLADAVNDPDKRRELGAAVGEPALAPSDVLALLKRLTQHLHRLQIRTLDSFLAAIVRSFAVELQLPLDAQMVEDDRAQALRGEAIRLMLDERNPQDLVELLRLLTRGCWERRVTETIDRVVSDMFEQSRDAPHAAWECVPVIPGRLSRTELVAAIENLAGCLVSGKSKVDAHAKSIDAARRHDWEAFVRHGFGKPLSVGQSTYSSRQIEPQIIEVYQPLVRHAVATLVERWRDQTLATRELLGLYKQQYERVRTRDSAMTFADLTAAIAGAPQLGAMEEICYRLDATVHHLLLDEFQDTSILQWRALEPIAREIVSHAPPQRTFFSVGDVKQSIYGWRHAAPEVLDELPDLLVGMDGRRAIAQSTLAESWRSSPVVIDAVNEVFGRLSSNAALDEFSEAVAKWSSGFEAHRPVEKNSRLPGRVELRVATSAPEATPQNVHRLQQAALLARDLQERSPSHSIMILVRKNAAVARLLFELGPSRLNLGASGRGGGPLTDAPAVNAVLDLLHLSEHPGDTVAAFHVAHSPLGPLVGLARYDSGKPRRRIARSVRRAITAGGHAAMCAELASGLAERCDAREQRRLMALVELAAEFDQRGRGCTRDFISMVESTAVADAQPGMVEVMTVHQAKGLEADVVILPELEWKLTDIGSPGVVFEREGETGPITRICRYANTSVRSLAPELEPLFERQKNRTVRESLSLMYVAMTRARQGLYMLIDPPKATESTMPKTAAGVLRSALAKAACEPGACVYSRGDESWLGTAAGGAEARPPANVDPQRDARERGRISIPARSPGIARAALRRSAASAHATADDFHVALRLPADESRERGTVIHAMFEQVQWLEDWLPDHDSMAALAARLAPRRGRAWASGCADQFMLMLNQPEIRSLLSRGNRNADAVQLWREMPSARFNDGALRTGVIDRLEAECERGRPVRGTVIDFKTDDVIDDNIEARAAAYANQMASYRAAAAEWLALPVSQVRTVLLFVACGRSLEIVP
jgi:ATP-dependent exoDNAse (exonuclease V) beta subunit